MEAKPRFTEKRFYIIIAFVTSLFLLWGVAMTMGDVLNKHFQNVLHISKSRSGLVQLSIFGAYGVMGIPAGLFMKRFGYKRGVQLGLFLYACGAFLFVPASNAESFTFFRVALFILACGLATLEAVAHPFVASLGDQRTSDQRINFAQAFNGIGGVIGPLIGSYFILRAEAGHTNDLVAVKHLYIVIGAVITVIGLVFSFVKVPKDLTDPHVVAPDAMAVAETPHPTKKLFQNKHFVFAVVAQLFNVAAQGGTWAYFINYGHEKMHLTDAVAANYFAFSIFMMMIGRFIGTFLMRYISPNKLLAIFAACNIVMCIIVSQAFGWVSFGALIMINFFFSIMFPTIFSLGLKDLGRNTQQGASFIVMGVVGGALFPPLMGLIANKNVATSYLLPIICYLVIFAFASGYNKLKKAL
ncbi:L-fucose:H+ symporter permease [Mucilaginibacter conchicola]|uniref:L-fucose:H+ symporter permease n=1 Tax=Mucilaginibacter conchicola TaxID=2303333 RepID=A0A372NYB8_9SPHI|nr:L-fucose:H+ symporter permease [Mucilaginibacter conchicola]RFZ94894.1 L-fucose:H+ symporter permease [Mucilaginibacter conchicola]